MAAMLLMAAAGIFVAFGCSSLSSVGLVTTRHALWFNDTSHPPSRSLARERDPPLCQRQRHHPNRHDELRHLPAAVQRGQQRGATAHHVRCAHGVRRGLAAVALGERPRTGRRRKTRVARRGRASLPGFVDPPARQPPPPPQLRGASHSAETQRTRGGALAGDAWRRTLPRVLCLLAGCSVPAACSLRCTPASASAKTTYMTRVEALLPLRSGSWVACPCG